MYLSACSSVWVLEVIRNLGGVTCLFVLSCSCCFDAFKMLLTYNRVKLQGFHLFCSGSLVSVMTCKYYAFAIHSFFWMGLAKYLHVHLHTVTKGRMTGNLVLYFGNVYFGLGPIHFLFPEAVVADQVCHRLLKLHRARIRFQALMIVIG